MDAVLALSPQVGIQAACDCLDVARATFYRQRPPLGHVRKSSVVPELPASRPKPARALDEAERTQVLTVLHEDRFQDSAPAAIQAQLLDEGRYLCAVRTMYRILAAEGESRERRDHLVHPPYQKPELLATAPNQVWSWDITKLPGPAKWTYFYLYVILDIYSRYVTGWMVADRESAELAKYLLDETIHKHNILRGNSPFTPTVAELCWPNPSRCSMPISVSPSRIAAPTFPTTILSPKVSSARSSTDRISQPVSVASLTAALIAKSSFLGITKSTATPALAC